eukprot:6175420-Pleurochrysis_carterae.AAC.1
MQSPFASTMLSSLAIPAQRGSQDGRSPWQCVRLPCTLHICGVLHGAVFPGEGACVTDLALLVGARQRSAPTMSSACFSLPQGCCSESER